MNKWIILDNRFISGNVGCHFELIPTDKWENSDVSGGGLFIADISSKTLILFEESINYGGCTVADISKAEFHFRWDDYTIFFTTAKYFEQIKDMPRNEFDWIREPIIE